MIIEALPFEIRIGNNTLKTTDARNPFVSYDLEEIRKTIQNQSEILNEFLDKITDEKDIDSKAVEFIEEKRKELVKSQIEYYKLCFVDYEKAKSILRNVSPDLFSELTSKIQIAQFGGQSEKKNQGGVMKKRSSSRKGTQKKK